MKKKLLIDGMSCNHCVNHVRTALTEDIKGVEVREVSLDGKYAIVNMDDSVKEEELIHINYPNIIPKKVLSPREAFYSDKKEVKLKDSIGKVSGEYIIPYPPGISLTSPGEITTKEVIDYILICKEYGMNVSGLKDKSLDIIEIIEN